MSKAKWCILFLCVVCLAVIFLFPGDAYASAQLALTVVGGAIGAWLGGPVGFAIGASLGSLAGQLIFPNKLPTVYGPRLSDKTVQSASFGQHITKLWGTDRLQAQVIFSSGLKETQHKKKLGGKGMIGGGSQTQVTFTYSVDIMLAFCRRAHGVKRVWADTKLIYQAHSDESSIEASFASNARGLTLRPGDEDQLPSALEESYHGTGNVSAHRGLFCIEAADLQLADFANRIPNFTAEVFTEGDEEDSYVHLGSYTAPDLPVAAPDHWVWSWGQMDSQGEVYAYGSSKFNINPTNPLATVLHWTPAEPSLPVHEPKVHTDYTWTGSGWLFRVRSDEQSYAYWTTGRGYGYYAVNAGTEILITLAELGANHQNGDLMIKRGGDLHAISGNCGWLGPDPNHLMLFDLSGTKMAETRVLYEELGKCTWDAGRSENYLWAMIPSKLLKLNPETLELLEVIPLSMSPAPFAMAVVSDTEIYFVSSNIFFTFFWRMLDGTVELFQQVAENLGTQYRSFANSTLQYIDGPGLFLVGYRGTFQGFVPEIRIYGPAQSSTLGGDIPLWKICRDISLMAGADSVVDSSPPSVGDIAVSELTDPVHGYSLTRSMSAREAMAQLQQTYFFDIRELNLKLDFPKRGKAAVEEIPGADLSARSAVTESLPDRLAITRARETDLPMRVHVIYNNWEANYQPGHEYAPRLITEARATVTLEISVAITSTKARELADALLALAWLERESFTFRASRKHLLLDAADNVEIAVTEE